MAASPTEILILMLACVQKMGVQSDPEFCGLMDKLTVMAGSCRTWHTWFEKISKLKGSTNDVAHLSSPAPVDKEALEFLAFIKFDRLPSNASKTVGWRTESSRRDMTHKRILKIDYLDRDSAWM